MKRPFLIPVLSALLVVSVALNLWQFLRPPAVAETSAAQRTLRSPRSEGPLPKPSGTSNDEAGETKAQDEPKVLAKEAAKDLATAPEGELLFGSIDSWKLPTHGEARSRTTTERLKALAKEEPSQAKKFRVQAVLHLPGGRTTELSKVETGPGGSATIQMQTDLPFPSSISFAEINEDGSLKPTTPANFDTRERGIEIEVDVTPAAGALVLGGQIKHRTLDGFGQMPGELFSPIHTTQGGEDVVLTDNKVLQPQFSVAKSPFLAAATAGQPCRVPVRMTWGQTILELTCTPVE